MSASENTMKQFLLTLVGILLLAACAPAPTPVPTSGPPTRALPQPTVSTARPPATSGLSGTPAPITITGVTKETTSEGEVRTTARAAAEGDLGVGQIEV